MWRKIALLSAVVVVASILLIVAIPAADADEHKNENVSTSLGNELIIIVDRDDDGNPVPIYDTDSLETIESRLSVRYLGTEINDFDVSGGDGNYTIVFEYMGGGRWQFIAHYNSDVCLGTDRQSDCGHSFKHRRYRL